MNKISRTQISIKDRVFIPYLSKESIQNRIEELGEQLREVYSGQNPIFLGILNGSFVFLADLLRATSLSSEVKFMQCNSYIGTKSSGDIKLTIHFDIDEFKDRHVIIVEDIVDTGSTLAKLTALLESKQCASIQTVCLLFKPAAFTGTKEPEIVGFRIPNDFVVGYGLDYDGYGRELKDIMVISE